MPKKFKNLFCVGEHIVHVRKRKRSKYGYHYEARFRQAGFNISVSCKNYEELKEKFIAALKSAEMEREIIKVSTNFDEFTAYYFETFRKRKVAAKTLEGDKYRYKNHIKAVFGDMNLKDVTPLHCQRFLDGLAARGYGKTTKECLTLLNQIFKYAMAHNLIRNNPLSIVLIDGYEETHAKVLTKEEEKTLLEQTAGTRYQLLFAVALYTGMRPNEYYTARIEGDFIIAKNSKRKNKKVEYKRIAISPMLKPYLENVTELHFVDIKLIREKIKSILPGHKPYDLRKTFNTRCVECGVADAARKHFMGHTLGKLEDIYTDLSNEYLLKEGNKLNY